MRLATNLELANEFISDIDSCDHHRCNHYALNQFAHRSKRMNPNEPMDRSVSGGFYWISRRQLRPELSTRMASWRERASSQAQVRVACYLVTAPPCHLALSVVRRVARNSPKDDPNLGLFRVRRPLSLSRAHVH